MKLKFFLVVLLGMIMIMAGVSAMNEMNESESVTGSEENAYQNISLFTEEAKDAFSPIDDKIMMVAEGAYDYLVSGDGESKQVFFDTYASLEGDMAAFEEKADLKSEGAGEFKASYDELTGAVITMETLAEKVFDSYEMNETIDSRDFDAFEAEVERAMTAQEAAWDLGFDSGTGLMKPGTYRVFLAESLHKAIKESYAYLVLGSVSEKEEVFAAFSDFNETVAAAEEQYPDESFDDLKKIKSDLMQSVERIFATYEVKGVVDVDEFADLKSLVESFYKIT